MRFLLKTLLAAAALMPVAANAQDADAPRERGGRGSAPDRPRGEMRERAPGNDQPRFDRPQPRGPDARMGEAPRQNRDDPRVDRFDRAERAGRPDAVQPHRRNDPSDRPERLGQPGPDRRDDMPQRFGNDRGANDRAWNDRNVGERERADRERANRQRIEQGDRARFDRARDADRFRAEPWRDDRRFDDRRGWNADWRNDRRYDWNRYRAGNRSAYRLPRYYAPYGWSGGYRRFSIGVTLSSILFGQDYWIDDPYAYRLPDAYGPYRWVRYYDDALLVDIRYGRVVDVVYGIFW